MGEAAAISELLGKGGWGVAALSIAALIAVWRWAIKEIDDARGELKTLNERAWTIVDRAQRKDGP